MSAKPNLTEWRERAEFWASRDPDSGLYDKDAVAFACEVVALLDLLQEARDYCARPAGVCLPRFEP